MVAFAPEILRLWLGDLFANESTAVLQVLAIGVLVNSLAQVPFGVIQASGRPDVTAKLHLIELVPYAVAVYWATVTFGIIGTAGVWLVRAAADSAVLFGVSFRILKFRFELVAIMGSVLLLALFIIGAAIVPIPTFAKAVYVAVILCGFVWLAWYRLLTEPERTFVSSALRRKWPASI
jgi:O-antigen/teichoic acid export membrane protein